MGPPRSWKLLRATSRIALIDVHAKDADAAIEAAWAAYGGHKSWPLKVTSDSPDKDGWSNIRGYDYQTSPKSGVAFGLRRNVQAMFGTW